MNTDNAKPTLIKRLSKKQKTSEEDNGLRAEDAGSYAAEGHIEEAHHDPESGRMRKTPLRVSTQQKKPQSEITMAQDPESMMALPGASDSDDNQEDAAQYEASHGFSSSEEQQIVYDTMAALKDAMGVESVEEMLSKYLGDQRRALENRVCIGTVMLGTANYLNKGVDGLRQYMRDSHQQGRPLVAHAFMAFRKQDSLYDMDSRNFFKYKQNDMIQAVGRSKFWYYLFQNIDILENKGKIKFNGHSDWDTLKNTIKIIWGLQSTKKQLVVKRMDRERSTWYEIKCFKNESNFEEACWKSIDEYWVKNYGAMGAQRAVASSVVDITEEFNYE